MPQTSDGSIVKLLTIKINCHWPKCDRREHAITVSKATDPIKP